MKCPYCQNEMEQGYIQNRDGVAWTKKEHFVMALAPYAGDSLQIGSRRDGKSAEAFLCKNCKKILIDIPEETEV